VIYEAQVIAVAFINVSKFSFAVFYLANLHDKKLIYTRRRHCQKEECIKKIRIWNPLKVVAKKLQYAFRAVSIDQALLLVVNAVLAIAFRSDH